MKRAFPDTEVVWLDAGNFFDTPGPVGEIKTAALIRGMNAIGYDAVGLGEQDLALGPQYYEEMTAGSAFEQVTSNVVRASTGAAWKRPYLLIEAGGRVLGVLALLRFDPTLVHSLPEGDRLLVRDPREVLEELLPELRAKADLVAVLVAMPLEEARLLARQVEGADLILGGYQGELTGDLPIREGDTSILYAGRQGQDMGEIRAHFREDGKPQLEFLMHRLDSFYPEDPETASRVRTALAEVNDYHRRMAERRLAGGEETAAGGFVGVEACRSCHPMAVELYEGTAHASAFSVLEDDQADFNPECVGCHVVGFGMPGGFVDALGTPEWANVQCEACHGAAGGHVDEPDMPFGRVRISTCTACHDTDNSPDFNFYSFWPRIRHGSD